MDWVVGGFIWRVQRYSGPGRGNGERARPASEFGLRAASCGWRRCGGGRGIRVFAGARGIDYAPFARLAAEAGGVFMPVGVFNGVPQVQDDGVHGGAQALHGFLRGVVSVLGGAGGFQGGQIGVEGGGDFGGGGQGHGLVGRALGGGAGGLAVAEVLRPGQAVGGSGKISWRPGWQRSLAEKIFPEF